MKKIINILAAISSLVVVSSCNGWLDRPSLGVMDEPNFFESNDAALGSVFKCYYSLHDVYGYEVPRFAIGDVCTDDAEKGGSDAGDNAPIYEMAYGLAISSNNVLNNFWKQMYAGIGNCNVCLDNFPLYELVDSEGYPVTEEDKSRYVAEVRFLRAFMYFELAKAFGGVPLVTTTLTPADSKSIVRATEDDTFKFIVDELQAAIESAALPTKAALPAAELGRVTVEAAWALKGKVEMFWAKNDESHYAEALSSLKNVIGKYSLEPKFQSLWLEDNYYSDEAIFVDIRGDEPGQNIYGSFIPVFCSPRSTGAYGFDQPTQNLVDEFEEGDPRLLFTIIQPGDKFPAGNKTEVLDFSTYPSTGYHSRKAFMVKSRRGLGWGDDAFSYMHMRYADILLLYAEAIVRTGGDKSEAVRCINEVRTRANNSRGEDVEATERVLIIPNIPLRMVSESDDLLTAIKHERRVELAMEYNRYYDLKRWGEYVDRMSEVRSGSFQKGKSEFFPIPQVEIDRTGGSITQNPGY